MWGSSRTRGDEFDECGCVVVFAAAAAADVGALIENARMQMLFCVMQFLKMFPERERAFDVELSMVDRRRNNNSSSHNSF